MMIKEEEIRKYARIMREMDLTGLEVDEKNQTVRLERTPAGADGVFRKRAESVEADLPQDGVPETPAVQADYISVTSPMVGTFYQAPEAEADPYVRVGDVVEKGATLCIIEAMKLMNEIPAETSGEILAVCVADGDMVEYGTELFRIGRERAS